MRALHWDGSRLAVRERAAPSARSGYALVGVHLAGVCNTDLEIVRGYMGFRGTPGHEMVGTVLDGPAEWLGRRVVGEINFACGECESCAAGLGRHCPARRVMGILDADGAFAELVAVPVANLHAVPEGVADRAAVFAEPLAAAFEILEQVHIDGGARCVVFGDGKLGLLVAQVLATTGAEVVAVGKHAEKLAILARRGIRTALLDEWEVQPADVVVEATGSPGGFAHAVEATRPRGTLVLKSTVAERLDVDLAPVVINEISIVGSRCGPFAPALRALASGDVEVAELVSEVRPLAEAAEAFTRAATTSTIKVLVDARAR